MATRVTDTLDGDAGNDILNGGVGNDDLFAGTGNDILNGDSGNDELFGAAGDDTLNGGDGADELEGDAGADQLRGGAVDDEFVFFIGTFNPSSPFATSDRLLDFEGAGAVGGDLIELANSAAPLVFRGEASLNPVLGALLPGAGNGVTEVLYTIRGGTTWLLADGNDNGLLDGTDFALRLVGTHNLATTDFTASTAFVTAGTDGDDLISGTEGDDVIFGLAGNDQLFGLGGNDELDGGAGNDVLDGGADPSGFDNLCGGDGNDTLDLRNSGFGGNAEGGTGDDLLLGSDAEFSSARLEGNEGNDDLRAGAAGDTTLIRGRRGRQAGGRRRGR